MESTVETLEWVSLSPLPSWALWLLVILTIAGAALAMLSIRAEPLTRKRWSLWFFRALAGVAVAFFLLEPGLRRLQVAKLKGRVAVLVDRSASMNFPVEPKGEPRRTEAVKTVDSITAAAPKHQDRFSLDFYGFDSELSPLNLESLRKEPAKGARTDLSAALQAASLGESGKSTRRLLGVVLVSDGADNGAIASRAKESLDAISALKIPVSTVTLGRKDLKDLSIESVKVDEFAFVRSSMTADVEVRARGFSGESVKVVLRRQGSVVATRDVQFQGDDDLQKVAFTFTPDQTGRFVYTLSVPVLPEEAVAENNTRSFSLKVIRDRMRVLLVSGRPSWDERFLRGLLRQDPNVELISFYILRNQSDQTGAFNDERELSLIPFPMPEIFHEKLNTFDVIIFQNFGYSEPGLSIAPYEVGLAEYVRNGGALLLIGGDRSFSEAPGRFGTLAEVLPLESALPADVQPFKPRLTTEGLRHPVTALSVGQGPNNELWAALPPVAGLNLTRAKEGATVLLEHPFATVGGRAAPLLALWDHGRGRVLVLASDGSWSWALGAHATGSPSRDYERFWSNALRWLVRDPDLTTLQVVADPPTVEPGKPVAVVVTARMPDYQPAVDAEVKVDLVSADDGHWVATEKGTTSLDGVARIEFAPPAPGAYRVVAHANKGTQSLGEGQDAVVVRAVGTELSEARVGADTMAQIAKATGGKAFTPSNFSLDEVPVLEPPMVEVGRSKEQPLWDRWYWLCLAVVIIGTEWALRRRFGYV